MESGNPLVVPLRQRHHTHQCLPMRCSAQCCIVKYSFRELQDLEAGLLSTGQADEKKEKIRLDVSDAGTTTGIRNYSHMFGIEGAYKNAATLLEVFAIRSCFEHGPNRGVIHCLEIAG